MIKNINLFVTEKCNLACKYCFVVENGIEINEKKVKTALKDILDDFSGKILTINFFGGETLLKIDLIKRIVIYLKRCNRDKKTIQFNLSTNGLLINKKIISWSQRNNVHILLSFDGEKLSHNKNRVFYNGKGSFDLAHRTLLLLIDKLGKKLIVRMTVEPKTVKNFYQNILFLYSLGVRKIAYSFVFERKWDVYDLNMLKKEILKTLIFWNKKINTEERIWIQPLQEFVKNKIYPENKTNLFAHKCDDERISISCSGEIYPCHRLAAIKKQRIGSIKNGKFELDEQQLKGYLLKKNKLFTKYHNFSGCPAINLDLNGSIEKPAKSFKKITDIHFSILNIFWKDLKNKEKDYIRELFIQLNKRNLY